jgi:nucleolar protein 53
MPAIHPRTVSTEAPATYNQPSRKGKKAWRKNIDITEVTKGLNEVKEEIIKGLALYQSC